MEEEEKNYIRDGYVQLSGAPYLSIKHWPKFVAKLRCKQKYTLNIMFLKVQHRMLVIYLT